MQHAEGRVMPDGDNWEYQYHLKDHLGNVRATITTNPKQYTYPSTMESELASGEDAIFGNLDAVRQKDVLYDHTHLVEGFGDESARLNAKEGTMVGPALSLYVKPGDSLTISVHSIYSGTPNSGTGSLLIADAVTSAFGVSSGENTATIYDALTDLLGGGSSFLGMNYDKDAPQAYLTYHYFDKNHQYITSGFAQVNDSQAGDWQPLSLQLFADQEGYVYIYVANETQEDFDVFFDDLEVDHVYGPVVQQDDYYPFGGTFNSYTSGTENLYKYNGKEEQKETEWLDFGRRMYDPACACWHNIDPKAHMFYGWSPYNFVMGNPVNNIDIKGEWTVPIHYSMTWQSLVMEHGVEVRQAQLLSHYTSTYADHPTDFHRNAGNVLHSVTGWNGRYRVPWMGGKKDYIDYSGTANSQETNWHPGIGHENYNVWHSMRSEWEAENGVSAEAAMQRGMEFGWSQVFGAAESGQFIGYLKANSKPLEMFGQGIHALQDAYAHRGTHIVDANHIMNDMRNNPDMKLAQTLTTSAVTVYKLMTGDFDGLSKKNALNITTTGMTQSQFNSLLGQIQKYLQHHNKKKEEEQK